MTRCSNNAPLGDIALVLVLMLKMIGYAFHTETSEKEENGRKKQTKKPPKKNKTKKKSKNKIGGP